MMELRNVSFRYAQAEQGVFDISLSLRPGECVVLAGLSGNGKTTLTRLVNGLAPAYYPGELSGAMLLGEEDAHNLPLWQRGKAVGSVFQDPKSQFFSSELAGEVAFACENYGLPHEEIIRRTDNAIAAFGLEGLHHRNLDLLSSGEKQRVAIASVYALSPGLYVCDEPSANLDEEGTVQLAKVLMQLKAEGHALLVAEHRLAWLMGIADRFFYLRNGRIVWEKTTTQMTDMATTEQISYGLRSPLPIPTPPLSPPSGDDEPMLSAQGLSYTVRGKTIWQNLSFSAWPGQVVALCGQNGAGKTTLAKVLCGLCRQSSGTVRMQGKMLSPAQRQACVWYSDNDTGTQFFSSSVSEEILLCLRRTEKVLDRARAILKRLGLYAYKDAHPTTLSGGQRQRLSIACGVLSGRDVLIFDEPTSGLDGENLRLVGEVFRELAAQGKCVLVITHDAELMQACCTHAFRLPE